MRIATAVVVVVASVAGVGHAQRRATGAPNRWCDEPCLVLTDTPLERAAAVFHAACGTKPTPDYTACRLARDERVCTGAAHGAVPADEPTIALGKLGKDTRIVSTEIWLAFDTANAVVAIGAAHTVVH